MFVKCKIVKYVDNKFNQTLLTCCNKKLKHRIAYRISKYYR